VSARPIEQRQWPSGAELGSHARVIEALSRLRIDGAKARGLLSLVAALPRHHEYLMRETAPEAKTRRSALAADMRRTAAAVDADPDAKCFFPYYAGPDGTEPRVGDVGRHTRELSVADWLRDCAEHVEQTRYGVAQLDSRRGHENLKSYVARGVSHHVRRVTGDRSPHNVETAMIASALLGETVTANHVTAARRRDRRRYWRE
jgi:hypothetical protein